MNTTIISRLSLSIEKNMMLFVHQLKSTPFRKCTIIPVSINYLYRKQKNVFICYNLSQPQREKTHYHLVPTAVDS